MNTATDMTTTEPKDWAGIGQYLQRDYVRLLDSRKQAALLDDWQEITHQEANLDDAILIGLVGGTGVGKSTFINALAGQEVSRSSDRRPTTDRVIVYRHVNTEVSGDVPSVDFAQPQVMHDNDRLEKVVLFDFPDFDSAEDSHTQIINRYLPFLDVLLVVVDDVKYADRRLYDLLRTLKHDPENIFVLLNKVDRLQARYGDDTNNVISELVVDLHDKLKRNGDLDLKEQQKFAIAALSVYEARLRGEETSASVPFARVEQVLEGFQAAKHRRAAKERNLGARKRSLTEALVKSALGPDNQSILAETKSLVHGWRGELDKALGGIPLEIFTDGERGGVRKNRLRQVGPSWGLPFSLFFTLLGELRRRKTKLVEPSDLGQRAVQHYRGFFEAIKNLQARFASEFAGSKIKLAPSGALTTGSELANISSKELSTIMQPAVQPEHPSTPGSKKWLAHVPAIAVLGLALWSKIYPVLESTANADDSTLAAIAWSIFSSLNPTFLVATALGVIVIYAITALVIWLREVQKLDVDINQAEKAARDSIRTSGERVVKQLDEDVQTLYDEFEQLEAMT